MSKHSLRESTRSYLDVTAPHFHICNGKRPGGHFLQGPAWEVRETVLQSVCQCVERAVNKANNQ